MIKLGKHSYHGTINDSFNADVTIGNFTCIGNNLTVLGMGCEHPTKNDINIVSSFPFFEKWNIKNYPPCLGGSITIGNDVWIGENVTILDGVTIADGAIIGAGSVVTKSIPEYTVFAGNPAKLIRSRINSIHISKLLQIAWWNWEDEKIKEALNDMQDIEEFVKKYG